MYSLLSLGATLLSGLTLSGCPHIPSSSLVTPVEGGSGRANKEFGTPHPVIFQESSPDGRWLIYCQARADTDKNGEISVERGRHGNFSGDELEPYLILGDGPERPIDDFVASDTAGNYLVVVIGQKLLLIDTKTGRETDLSLLGANPMDASQAVGAHRAASFDQSGQRLVYLRKTARGDIPVVRELANGQEIELDPGEGLVWRATLDAEGKWVTLLMVVKDTDGDGKLTLPVPVTNLAARRCRGTVSSYGIRGGVGDQAIVRVVPAAGGQAREVEGLVRPWGDRLLKRTQEGALVLESASGQSQELVPASCKGTLIHSDVANGQILVDCKGTQPESHMALYGQALHVDFTEIPLRSWEDILSNEDLRLYRSRHGFIDLKRRLAYHKEGASLYAQYQGRALLSMESRFILYDADTRSESSLEADEYSDGKVDQAASMVLLSTWSPRKPPGPAGVNKVDGVTPSGEKKVLFHKLLVFDLAKSKIVGQLWPPALAVTSDAYVLVAKGVSSKGNVAYGPLHWVKPVSFP